MINFKFLSEAPDMDASKFPLVHPGMSGLSVFDGKPSFIIRGYGAIGTMEPILFWNGSFMERYDCFTSNWPKDCIFHEGTDTGKTLRWCADILSSIGITMWVQERWKKSLEHRLLEVEYKKPPSYVSRGDLYFWDGVFAYPWERDSNE